MDRQTTVYYAPEKIGKITDQWGPELERLCEPGHEIEGFGTFGPHPDKPQYAGLTIYFATEEGCDLFQKAFDALPETSPLKLALAGVPMQAGIFGGRMEPQRIATLPARQSNFDTLEAQ
jgi:hypothetical protein